MHILGRQLTGMAAVMLLLLPLGANARQLDASLERTASDKEEEIPHQADHSEASHSHERSLHWHHRGSEADQYDSRADNYGQDNAYGSQDRGRVRFYQQQAGGREQDMRYGNPYDRSYDPAYDRQQGMDQEYGREEADRSSDQYYARDRMYQQYSSQDYGRRQYDNRDRMYQQYSSQYGRRQYDNRDRMYQQYAGRPWQHDRVGAFQDHHNHDGEVVETTPETTPENYTSGHGTHCGAHEPTEEEQINLANLLEDAAQWWDEFSGEIEEWLEEHGAVISDVAEELGIDELFDGRTRDSNAASTEKFNARVRVYWRTLVPKSGEVNGHTGKLSKKAVDAQIKVMNQAFKGTGFRFVLESMQSIKVSDEQFTACSEFSDPNAAISKNATRKGDATQLYIWSWYPCNGLLGYATFPEWFKDQPTYDGVVVKYSSLPGGSEVPFDLGMTAVHEVGHWLGLYHTFQGNGCTDKENDGVKDTPVQEGPTSGCPSPQPDTCPNQKGKDPIYNYMDYSDDVCLTQFTKGQIKRMQNAWKLRVKMSKS